VEKLLEVLGELGVGRELELLVEDVAEELALVARVVGRQTQQQLVEQCSQTVVVDLEAVALSR
jgi:hypothetical protein